MFSDVFTPSLYLKREIMTYERYEDIKTISVKQAETIAKKYGHYVSRNTLIEWVMKFKLGFQPSGNNCRWFIFEQQFIDFVSGNVALLISQHKCTLRKIRNGHFQERRTGRRTSPINTELEE